MKELLERKDTQHIFEAAEIVSQYQLTIDLVGGLVEERKEEALIQLNLWCKFFNDHFTAAPCIYNAMISGCAEAAETNSLFALQTEHQFQLSKQFFQQFFDAGSKIILKPRTGHKLLIIALIYGYYPGMVIRSLREYIPNLDMEVSFQDLDDLFHWLFVKYEIPYILTTQIHYFNLQDLDFLMYVLQGNRPEKYPSYFRHLGRNKLTKKEGQLLFSGPLQFVQFEDQISLRATIACKLFRHNEGNIRILIVFLDKCHTFQENLNAFIGLLPFWIKVFHFLCHVGFSRFGFSLEEYIDYFEYIALTRGKNYSFKRRTMRSIANAVNEWHHGNQFRGMEHLQLRSWTSRNLSSKPVMVNNVEFRFKEITTGERLKLESMYLKHCVYSYVQRCIYGNCSIVSLEVLADDEYLPLITIEVQGNKIVQALGAKNRFPTNKESILIRDWAYSNKLDINQCQHLVSELGNSN